MNHLKIRNLCALIGMMLGIAACSSLDKIATESEETNSILQRIDSNTNQTDQPSVREKWLDSVNVTYPAVNLNELRSHEIIRDSSAALSENWFIYALDIKYKTNPALIHRYQGYYSIHLPNTLYVRSHQIDSAKISGESFDKDSITPGIQTFYYPYRILNVNETDWQKCLMQGAVFEGFDIRNRNFNFLDLSRFNLNYTMLRNDTFYGSRAISNYQNLGSSNTFREMVLDQSLIINNEWRNWNIIGKALTGSTWNKVQIIGSDIDNVMFDRMEFFEIRITGSVIRQPQYGKFNQVVFTKGDIFSATVERANFDQVKFISTWINSGWWTNNSFTNCHFIGSSVEKMRIENCDYFTGTFTNCTFGPDFEMIKTNWRSSQINGGKLIQARLINDSYIADCTIDKTMFLNVNFGNTGLIRTEFKGGTGSTERLVFNGCDFRSVKWGELLVFRNCEFVNCLFPSDFSEMQNVNVQFIDCEGKPY